jgi:hypothetical protein
MIDDKGFCKQLSFSLSTHAEIKCRSELNSWGMLRVVGGNCYPTMFLADEDHADQVTELFALT